MTKRELMVQNFCPGCARSRLDPVERCGQKVRCRGCTRVFRLSMDAMNLITVESEDVEEEESQEEVAEYRYKYPFWIFMLAGIIVGLLAVILLMLAPRW